MKFTLMYVIAFWQDPAVIKFDQPKLCFLQLFKFYGFAN